MTIVCGSETLRKFTSGPLPREYGHAYTCAVNDEYTFGEKIGAGTADDDIRNGRIASFNSVDEMLASLKRPFRAD